MNEDFRSIELRELDDDSLYHHGVLGMSWGKRNGPPYPLGVADKKFARAEAKRKKERERQIAKMQKGLKKARKAKARADKKERKRLIKEEKIMRRKEELLKRDNYSEIMKNKKLFTAQELREIRNRHDAAVLDKMNNFLAKTNTAVNTIQSVANIANAFKTIQSYRTQVKKDDLDIADKTNKIKEQVEKMKRDAEKHKYEIATKKQDLIKAKGLADMQKAIADKNRMQAIQERNKTMASFYEQSAKIADEASKNYESRIDLAKKINDEYFTSNLSRKPSAYSLGKDLDVKEFREMPVSDLYKFYSI